MIQITKMLNRLTGSVALSLSIKPVIKAGKLVGITICLWVKAMSTKGKIESKVTPFKRAEMPVQTRAIEKSPSCGFKNFSNFK